jgi:hypothetical protein
MTYLLVPLQGNRDPSNIHTLVCFHALSSQAEATHCSNFTSLQFISCTWHPSNIRHLTPVRQHFLVLLLKIQPQLQRINLQSTTGTGTFTPNVSIVHLQFLIFFFREPSFHFPLLYPANMEDKYYLR